MSIVLDGAAPIERFGRMWKPWTKKQMIELTAKVPVGKVEQILLSYNDMLRFVTSVRGLEICLAVAGGCKESDVEKLGAGTDRIEIAVALWERFVGEFGSTGNEGDPSPPLAGTGSTGG